MASKIILVPDIGGFSNVSIIDICTSVGASIEKEQAILILESDKATIEVPCPDNGKVIELLVKVGDKVSQGDAIINLEVIEGKSSNSDINPQNTSDNNVVSSSTQENKPAKVVEPAQSQSSNTTIDNSNYDYDVAVIGAGPAGYSAAFRCADLGLKVALIEKYSTLGGVCLNVGCIPSKALLHMAEVLDEAKNMHKHGISFGNIEIDINKIREHKESVISKLTKGLAGMAKMRKVDVINGLASFDNKHKLNITNISENNLETKRITFRNAIIAVGSEAVSLPFLPKDDRIVSSTGALALKSIPKRMLVIGGGIIGLEMATVYASLGSAIDIVEMSPNLMAGADADLVKVWQKYNQTKFNQIMLSTKTTGAIAKDDAVYVDFEDKQGTKTTNAYDLVLVSVGRIPNGAKVNADAVEVGVNVTDRGFIPVDNQQRTNIDNIFAIGDVVGQPMLAHKGVHEGHVAAEVIAGHKAYFDAKQIPSVAYTNPEVSWAGLTENQCNSQNIAYKKSVFPWQASGRAIANTRDEGFVKLLFDVQTGRIIGGGIVGTHAGDLIGEVALAIEMGADAIDIGKTIHPHPTLCESIGMAAEVFEGSCTDLPPSSAVK
jgi:dihydrolipoamide dehydrogenase